MPRSTSISLALVSLLALACGAPATPSGTTAREARPAAIDIAGATPLHGPFASWEEICGAPLPPPEGASDGAADLDRRERCTAEEVALAAGGPFLAMATYHEGSPYEGSSYLALRTERGWFVVEVPDGEPFGGGLSHHTPSSLSFDPASTRLEDGVLRVVARGSSSSFVPGMGPLGSTHHTWTSVQSCGLRDGIVVCTAPEQVHSRTCGDGAEPSAEAEPACQEQGTDIAPR